MYANHARRLIPPLVSVRCLKNRIYVIKFSRNRFKGVRETSGLVNMKNKVLPKITNISAIVDIVGAVAFFIVQIINAAKPNFVSASVMLGFLIASAVAIILFFVLRVIGIAVGTKSLKVLTIISYIVDVAWVISMIFVLKNLNIF